MAMEAAVLAMTLVPPSPGSPTARTLPDLHWPPLIPFLTPVDLSLPTQLMGLTYTHQHLTPIDRHLLPAIPVEFCYPH